MFLQNIKVLLSFVYLSSIFNLILANKYLGKKEQKTIAYNKNKNFAFPKRNVIQL